MSMLQKLDLGGVSLELVDGGSFWLDAGAMFGLVPKAVWEKKVTADAGNRVKVACNVPLVRMGKRNILVDLGSGDKFDKKSRDIYSLDDYCVYKELSRHGLSPEQITDVIFTHLHFDHAGGVSRWKDPSKPGEPVLNFPNASYHVQKEEWSAATHPNELNRRSYLEENIGPLAGSGRVILIDGDKEILPGVTVLRTGGHTHGHQAVRIQGRDSAAYVLGDILCFTEHLRLTWLTAFDRDTYASLEAKKKYFARVADENAFVWLYHDPNNLVLKIHRIPDEPEYDYDAVLIKGRS